MLHHLKHRRAFTLLETMVVLLIIAIVTTIAVMTFDRFDTGRAVNKLIKQLQVVVQMASQQAILQPAVIQMRFSDSGYQFYQLIHDMKSNKDKWIKLKNDKLSQPNLFPSRLVVIVKSQKNIFNAKKGRVVFYPNGDVSPFELMVRDEPGKHVKKLIVNAVGGISHQNPNASAGE